MENARRLLDLWAWLPAFRAAAETEHLPSAAAKLHLTPSALSRSVRLLEDSLGKKLFERSGRRLVLNRQGRLFLAQVRTAMRVVDDGVEAISSDELRGTVRLHMPPDLSEWLAVPALLSLHTAHPELQLELLALAHEALPQALHQGDLDVAVTSAAIESERDDFDLMQEPLAELDYAVYARKGHELAEHARCSHERLQSHAFVAAPGDGLASMDRQCSARASDLRSAASIASASDLLVGLPCVVGEPLVSRGQLARVPSKLPGRSAIFLVYRRPVATHARTEALLACLRQARRS